MKFGRTLRGRLLGGLRGRVVVRIHQFARCNYLLRGYHGLSIIVEAGWGWGARKHRGCRTRIPERAKDSVEGPFNLAHRPCQDLVLSGTVITINRGVHFEGGGSLVRSFSAVRFFEDTLMVARLAAFTRRTLFSANALHLEATTVRARPGQMDRQHRRGG